jgi:hypothetical protein
MNKQLITIGLALLAGCTSQKSPATSKTAIGNTTPKQIEFIDDNAYLLTALSVDKTYGYKESNPIKVGGAKEGNGPKNEKRFLNGLLGPNGEKLSYTRAGSCCHFTTPNGLFNKTGLLDIYKVTWEGSSDTLSIYINLYDTGELKVPVGLTARKK